MHKIKYDGEYSRRHFLKFMGAAGMVASAGVLAPLWSTIAHSGDISKAYPDELLSIEMYTKGQLKPGDTITADNVDLVKPLLDEVLYHQVKQMGRELKLVETTRSITNLMPSAYLEATLRNQGQAMFDQKGNVRTQDGKPWIGGNPFPEPKTAVEAIANITLSWGRHDDSIYAVRDWDVSPDGDVDFQNDLVWAEMNATARVNGSPYLEGHEDKLRYQSTWFTYPHDTRGTAFLNIWDYDQNEFPELYGYLPAFKRIRRFPSNQRFEPLVPGMAVYLSDAWASGDPMMTWGNYKVVGRGPKLAALSNNWSGDHENWEKPVHGGPKGQTFFETHVELVPETLVIEAEPVGYPRAPIGKKRIWIDMRTGLYVGYLSFDRQGKPWRSWDASFSLFEKGDQRFMDGNQTAWSWTHVHSHDVQTNRVSRFIQAKQVRGGYRSAYNTGEGIYRKYLTQQALRSLGS